MDNSGTTIVTSAVGMPEVKSVQLNIDIVRNLYWIELLCMHIMHNIILSLHTLTQYVLNYAYKQTTLQFDIVVEYLHLCNNIQQYC